MDMKEELMSDTIDDVIGEADEDEERLAYGHPTRRLLAFMGPCNIVKYSFGELKLKEPFNKLLRMKL